MHRAIEKVLDEHQETIDALRQQIKQLQSDLDYKDTTIAHKDELIDELNDRLVFMNCNGIDRLVKTHRQNGESDAVSDGAASTPRSSLTGRSSPPTRPSSSESSNKGTITGLGADPLSFPAISNSTIEEDGGLCAKRESMELRLLRDQADGWKRQLDQLRADHRGEHTQAQHYLSQWKAARTENERLILQNASLIARLRDFGIGPEDTSGPSSGLPCPSDFDSYPSQRVQRPIIVRRQMVARQDRRSVSLPLSLRVSTTGSPQRDEMRIQFARPRGSLLNAPASVL
jgi:prefoldin subunit 5